MRFYTVSAYFLAVVLIACGKTSPKSANASGSDPTTGPVTQQAAGTSQATELADAQYGELGGSWQSSCKADATLSSQFIVTFTPAHAFQTTVFYSDTACTTVYSKVYLILTYKSGALNADGSRKLDWTTAARALQPVSTADVALENTRAACGYRDWQAGVPKLVPGDTCLDGGSPVSFGVANYTIYKVSASNLNFGDTNDKINDGSSDAKRPSKLSAIALTKLAKIDSDVSDHLPIYYGSIAPATATQIAPAAITLVVPEMPDTSADASSYLEFAATPVGSGTASQTLQVDAQKTTSWRLPPGNYTVNVSLRNDANKSLALKSGSLAVTITAAGGQSFTIDIK